ncbi:MAG: aminotransferase class IV [Actinobacteria bacterium]|nr:aminotransferase class IV [Actinomycetota bacterium]
MSQAWVATVLVPSDAATVSVFDQGFRSGIGIFETIRAYDGHPFRLATHLERASAGAAHLAFEPPPHDQMREAVHATAAANADVTGADAVLRLTVTPGVIDPRSPHPGTTAGPPTLVVTAHPLVIDPWVYRDGVAVTVVPWGREVPHVKAVSYLSAALARQEADRQGVYEALLTNGRGQVLEGSFSNVFAVITGRLRTPALDAGILSGVTRAVVLEVASAQGIAVHEGPLPIEELTAADEVFLTATTREVVPVIRVTGRRIGSGRPGPVTGAVHEGYREIVRREAATAH